MVWATSSGEIAVPWVDVIEAAAFTGLARYSARTMAAMTPAMWPGAR